MNAADDKENTDTNGSSDGCSGNSVGSNSSNGMGVEHVGCSKQPASSAVCNGARPKTQSHVCNIPNGLSQHNYTLKLNNNSNGTEGENVHNGNGMDVYMRNNVDYCVPVEKCPPKVRKHVNEKSESNSRFCKKDEDSLSENEEEDECCIYTYKGDQNQIADLPSSFFRLGVVPKQENQEAARSSSPDMDYLEMDFDPGPSNGGGDSSDDSDCCDMQNDEDRQIDDSDDGHSEDMQRRSVSPSIECEPVVVEDNPEEVNDDISMNGTENICSNLHYFIRRQLEEKAREDSEIIKRYNIECVKELNSISSSGSGEPKNDLSGNGKGNATSSDDAQPSTSTSTLEDHVNTSVNALQQAAHATNSLFFSSQSSGSQDLWGYHYCSGDLCSPSDPTANNLEGWCEKAADYIKTHSSENKDARYNLRSALYHCIMAKRLVLDKQASFSDDDQSNLEGNEYESPDSNRLTERIMIWKEQEACAKQVTQIGTSLCGATAVINVMVAFNMPFTIEKVTEGVKTNLRNENAPVPEYLFSRSVAGTTHEDIILGIDSTSQGALYSRFFHLYPDRDVNLSAWLGSWMKKGAIPIITTNLQKGISPDNPIPDGWHHQMVFGVGARGIYVTNPLECVPEKKLLAQLSSARVLKIRRADILSRWTPTTDLTPLTKHPDVRWKRMNVLGQVSNVIREAQWSRQGLYMRNTSHISIPAAYSSGITLVMARDNPAYEELISTPELSTIET